MAYTFGQASQKINQSPVDVEPALDASSTPTGYTFGQASKNINKAPTPPPPQVSTGRKTAEILAPSTTALSDYVRASSRLKSGEIDFMQKEREALISSKDPKAKTRINEIDTEIAKVIANADKTTGQKFGMAIGTGIEMSGVAELAALGGAVGRYGLRKVLGKAATEVAPKDVYTPFAGSKAANFITKATTIAPKTATEEAAYKASSLGSKAKVIAKDTAKLMPESVGFGYGYDVSMGLQEGEGTESLKPGAMTAIGAALPVAIGGTRLAKNAVVPSKAKAIDSLEQTYADLMSGTTPGKKKISKIEQKTEMMDKAGTTGKTPMRTLAEGGIIPKRNGPKLDTFEQAQEYRSGITYLKDANKQALEEVGLSSQLTKLDDLEASAIKYANSQRNIDSGRAPKMVKEIQKEFEYLREAYPEGVIPIGKVDEIKSARWDNVFGNKGLIDADVLKKDSEYAIAKAMQKHIEEVADVAGNPEVAQLNREIGDRLEAAKFLEDLNGKTIKGGRLLKYMTTGIGATLGNTVPGKILGALGGNLAGEIIIATNISGPMKRLILRNLSKQDPAAYTKTIEWLSKQKLDKETRLLLPAPKTTMMGGTDIKGNKILPSGQKVAKPLEFLPQSKSPNNAQTTKAISNDAIMPDSIPLTKNAVKEDVVDNLDHLSEKDKAIVEKWLNSNPDETERQLYKAAKDFDDYINAQYDQGIDRYNGVIKYIEGGAKNKDGVLPEMGVTSGKNSNGRKMREFVTVKDKDGKYVKKEANPLKFQKRGDTFIEELGFNDKEEAQDFIDYFRKIIEQRAISKKDLASFTNPALKNSYGAVAGIQVDEDGNVTFSPEMAAIGMIGGHLAPKMNLFKEAKGSTLANFLKVAKTVAGKSEDELKRLWENANKGGLGKAKILQKGTKHDKDLAKALSESKGMSAEDIMAKNSDIQLKRDVVATDLDGKKITIPEGEALTPYEMKGGKVVLQDGETYVVSKNQYQNIKGNAITGEKPKNFFQEFVDNNVEERVYGKSKDFTPEQKTRFKELEKEQASIYKEKDDLFSKASIPFSDAQEARLKELNNRLSKIDEEYQPLSAIKNTRQADPTTYHSYTLPGGKNYKEILIKAPNPLAPTISVEDYIKKYREIFPDSRADDRMITNYWKDGNALPKAKGLSASTEGVVFKSSHWEDPNVLSHVRMADHTYNGKKVTFLEEIQSDWARKLRKKVSDLANEEDYNPVPNHPLLKNWQEMSIKRALKEAVDNDAEYFAWINGAQTKARYNLSKDIENVNWDKTSGADKQVKIKTKEGKTFLVDIDDKGKIGFTTAGADWKGKRLDEVIGKGLADKIMADESGKLAGEGLNFGGEWAEALYDRQVPNIVKDLTGAKVEMLDMGLPVGSKSEPYQISNGPYTLGENLTKDKMKVGLEVGQHGKKALIITKITGDGTFEGISKSHFPNRFFSTGEDFLAFKRDKPALYKSLIKEFPAESFDISTPKSQGQMGIKLTPEIKAMIRGEAPQIKKTSGKSPFGKAIVATGAVIGGAGLASADTSDIKFGEKDIKETKIRMGKYRYERTQEPTMFDGDALLKAIANNETGTATIKDPYSFNKWSDPKAGPLSKYGKDLGKYQITSARLKEKSKQFLGRVVTEKEFLSSPELQDKFIERQILWLKNQGLTPEQILAVHRHGWGDLSKKAIERALNERKSYVDKAVSFIKENKKI